MKTMNLDKLAIGFLLGVCLMLVIGAGGKSEANPPGTYQISSPDNNLVWVINTRTGKLCSTGAGRLDNYYRWIAKTEAK